MKIVKTDGMLAVEPEQMALLGGLDVEFIERTLLTEDQLIAECTDADALLVVREPITARVIASLKKCKVIGRFGVGLDTIDVAAATAAGIQITNVPDASVDEVSTHALAMILSLSRRLKHFDAAVRAGRWAALADGRGIERPGQQRLGIVGFGKIGRLTARKARALGYAVVAYDPHLQSEVIAAEEVSAVSFNELIATSDVVSLHVPLTSETANIISADVIDRMKQNAILINVARGGLVNELALADALKSGKLAGAGLDTLGQEPPSSENPLLAVENLLLSPHAAHFSTQSYADVRNSAFADIAAVLKGETPKHPVNQLSAL